MNTQKQKTDIITEYREQIRHCARNLAVARNEAVAAYLPAPEVTKLVDVFTEGNLDKRLWKLNDQFEFLRDEFDELDDWMREYIHTVPLKAYDIGTTDSIVFLDWIRRHKTLTPEQLDYVTCHESRVAVEEAAREKRIAHLRFQDMLSTSKQLAEEFGRNPNLWIHLNPIRVWTTFGTPALLDEHVDLPAQLLFYPVGSDIRTAVMESEATAMLAELERMGPCRLEQLVAVMDAEHNLDREDVIDICRMLAEIALVAFG